MVHGFTRSKEGQAAYSKVGLRYEPHLQDELYDDWVRTTTADGLSNYTNHKEKELQSIKVVQVNNTDYTGEEGQNPYKYFIVYSWKHYRLDPACNVTTRTVSGQGKYPIPTAHYKITNMDFGKQKREADSVTNITAGYSIPWTAANIKKILKECSLPVDSKLQVGIEVIGGIKFHIESLADIMNGTPFEELAHFGRTPTEHERKLWIEKQGGTAEDVRRFVEIARKRAEGNIQQRPITAEDVQTLVRREIQDSKQQQ